MKKNVRVFFNEPHGTGHLVEFAFAFGETNEWTFLDVYHNCAGVTGRCLASLTTS